MSPKSLIALTVACAVAAAVFGFGSNVYAFRSSFDGLGREPLLLMTKLFVYVALGVLVVFRGGWWGVLAAILMAATATTIEWLLFPLAFDWAAVVNPDGYAERFGDIGRPSYAAWAGAYYIIGVGISAVLAQGLRLMAYATPTGRQDG